MLLPPIAAASAVAGVYDAKEAEMPSIEVGGSSSSELMDEGDHSKINSFLEDTARESHSSFHRSFSLEEEDQGGGVDNNGEGNNCNHSMLETADMSLSVTSTTTTSNPFARGKNEDLTSTGIQKKISQ